MNFSLFGIFYFLWYLIPIIIVVGIIVFFINRNKNNMQNNMEPNQPKTTAGDFLLNIGAIIALYTVVSFLLTLLFTVIENAYPQITNGYNYYGGYSTSISWPVSILIILFPIFVIIMWFLEKSYVVQPEKRYVGIRKWLTYITLFIGGAVLIGDLVTVVYYFIDGQDLTMGFILKIISVLVVTLIIFIYYVSDIRNKSTSTFRKIWLAISSVVVIGSIIWGFSVLGSPYTQRLIKYDEQKVSNLQGINSEVVDYFKSKKTLPLTINDISNTSYNYSVNIFTDQQTQKPYEYKKTGELSYDLCAEFNKTTSRSSNGNVGEPFIGLYNKPYNPYGSNAWSHQAGHYCFSQTIDTSNNNYPVSVPFR